MNESKWRGKQVLGFGGHPPENFTFCNKKIYIFIISVSVNKKLEKQEQIINKHSKKLTDKTC